METLGRRLVVAVNMSINGVVEFVDPWFDPGEQEDQAMLDVIGRHMAGEEILLLGRKTFEDFRGYWPHQEDDATGFARHLNQVPKYVVSTTMTEPQWQNSRVLGGDLVEEIVKLKAEPGGEIGVTGSISVIHALMAADLVDEYRLFVYPTLTSHGRSLMPSGMSMAGMTLAVSEAFPSGIVLLNYRRS